MKKSKQKKERKTSTVPEIDLTNPLEGLANGAEIALDILASPECKEVLDGATFIIDLDESELEERIREWHQENKAISALVAEQYMDCKDGFDSNNESFISDIVQQIKNLDLTEFKEEDKLATVIVFLLLDIDYMEMYSGEELSKKRTAALKFSAALVIIGTSLQIKEIFDNTPSDELMHTSFTHLLYCLGFQLGRLDMTNIMYPGSVDIGGFVYH